MVEPAWLRCPCCGKNPCLRGAWRVVEGIQVFGAAAGRGLRSLLYEGHGPLRRLWGRTGAATLEEGVRLWKRPSEASYFLDRERNPTWVKAGERVRRRYATGGGNVLDVGCGIGHLLRELGGGAVGLDSSFSNLYLARRWVAPRALLLCADAGERLPLADGSMDGVFSHEAFTYVAGRARLAAEMRRVWNGRRPIMLSHVHRTPVAHAHPVSREELLAWFPGARVEEDGPERWSLVADGGR